MKLFLDSSAYAKRFIEESGTNDVEELCTTATQLCLSVICVPEVISALTRRLREKKLTRNEYAHARQRLFHDANDAFTVHLTPDVLQSSIEVLEKNSVRTMDALHIACAIASEADLFVSSDRRQIAAAIRSRLKTKQV